MQGNPVKLGCDPRALSPVGEARRVERLLRCAPSPSAPHGSETVYSCVRFERLKSRCDLRPQVAQIRLDPKHTPAAT
jgi:hypothetical protein